MAGNAFLFVFASCVAVVASDSGDWESLELFAVLLVFSAATVWTPIRIGEDARRVTFGELPAIVLAVVLLGPGPAVAVATFGSILDALRHKVPADKTLQHLMAFATFPLVGALAFDALSTDLELDPDDPAFALLVIPAAHVVDALSFGIMAIQWRLQFGSPIWRSAREVFLPVLPVTTIAAPLIGAVTYGYGQIGIGAVVAAIPFALLVDYLLGEIARSRSRALEIERLADARRQLVAQTLDAEDAARRDLAQALHDDTIQRLLAAQQDIEAASAGDASAARRLDESVRSAVEQLRKTSFDLHPAVLQHAGLAAAVRTVAQHHAEKAGFEVHLELRTEADKASEQLLFSLAREFLANVVKHADASHVWVSLDRTDGRLLFEVRDDGRGFEPSTRTAEVMDGHIGLASVAERVEALGGTFAIKTGPGAGTRVCVALPPTR